MPKVREHRYFVYLVASPSRVLYVGVTNDIARRAREHRQKLIPGFTSRYNVARLVHVERFERIEDALSREKQIKGWRREKKIRLIETTNPRWEEVDIT